ncbi:Rubrerythrin [Streptomyces sp. DvalAA-14]|uniref:ferritin-like domain-containing protein n=1 Tax=unclassified Streptomyces TaxID=2593676 RepID=UPI00081B7619|nr:MULTISPECIES: ferritin-like domain-containing protein [unclassified Streptomyces]MYS21904.1 ferritin-like domain-containing protein [Streptomyces sp. SID4948]SCE03926.1 Rubrerythrin [Streptomyces sp. DvalAA-14]
MGAERIDTRLLAELTEQSQDLDSDAVRITTAALEDFTEAGREQAAARRWWRRGGTVTGAAGGAALLTQLRAVAATTSNDIKALQTAASIENLAIAVYKAAAALPFVKNGNKTISTFIAKTTTQHQAHAAAFNAAATQAGGKAQSAPDPKLAATVKQALPSIKTPADAVRLAITLEDAAAQTYTKNVGQVSSPQLRKLFASVAPVEAQHRATLLTVQALLAGNMADLIAIPTDVTKLPAAVGSAGIPDTFYPTTNASPITEGAVK